MADKDFDKKFVAWVTQTYTVWFWKKKSQKWVDYLGWSIEVDWKKYWLNIFKNEKKSDKHPDWNMVMTLAEEKTEAKVTTPDDDLEWWM